MQSYNLMPFGQIFPAETYSQERVHCLPIFRYINASIIIFIIIYTLPTDWEDRGYGPIMLFQESRLLYWNCKGQGPKFLQSYNLMPFGQILPAETYSQERVHCLPIFRYINASIIIFIIIYTLPTDWEDRGYGPIMLFQESRLLYWNCKGQGKEIDVQNSDA